MEKQFKDQNYWALVLGGSSGLGLASAIKLSKEGMNIIVVHRNSRSEMELINNSFNEIIANKVKFISFNIDAGNPEKRMQAISELKIQLGDDKIKCLIHSIAKGNLKAMVDESQPELQKDDFMITLEHMAISLYEWTKNLFKENVFATDTRIISFTSEGNTKAYKNYSAVSVAKAALEAISRNIALEFAPYGIRSNCIQAGVTDTRSLRLIPGSDKMKEIALSRNPFGKITTPEDVADVVYLLCKDEAKWINGTVIPVDGGESIVA
ncbi:enoyl-ACP reductase [Flavobacterium sp.]|jgi:enoyl-[acyl-carrier protein] reductase I|uniref:enoyl-ACP reductase n=1 Tax=Flavobacterium sp. TaxID=239 RepID=UPI0037BFE260